MSKYIQLYITHILQSLYSITLHIRQRNPFFLIFIRTDLCIVPHRDILYKTALHSRCTHKSWPASRDSLFLYVVNSHAMLSLSSRSWFHRVAYKHPPLGFFSLLNLRKTFVCQPAHGACQSRLTCCWTTCCSRNFVCAAHTTTFYNLRTIAKISLTGEVTAAFSVCSLALPTGYYFANLSTRYRKYDLCVRRFGFWFYES